MSSQLKNPPLVEALLELKWDLQKSGGPDNFVDPGFKIASFRLYDRIKKRFGHIQELPITIIPEEMTAYAVRNQFRAEQNGWPLVQIGPGVASVNLTPPYSWADFTRNVKYFVPHLFASYKGVIPGQPDYQLHLNSAVLRYINGIEWDWSSGNTLEFLRDSLHTNVSLPDKITAESPDACPVNVNLQIGYPIDEPKGQRLIRISTGKVGQTNGLVVEIMFVSAGIDTPQLDNVENFMKWVNGAHTVIEKSFFSLIEGELHKRFKGD